MEVVFIHNWNNTLTEERHNGSSPEVEYIFASSALYHCEQPRGGAFMLVDYPAGVIHRMNPYPGQQKAYRPSKLIQH